VHTRNLHFGEKNKQQYEQQLKGRNVKLTTMTIICAEYYFVLKWQNKLQFVLTENVVNLSRVCTVVHYAVLEAICE